MVTLGGVRFKGAFAEEVQDIEEREVQTTESGSGGETGRTERMVQECLLEDWGLRAGFWPSDTRCLDLDLPSKPRVDSC